MKGILFTVIFLLLQNVQLLANETLSEKLTYQVSYLGANIGKMIMSSEKKGDETRLTYHAEVTGWISMFYELNDHIETTINIDGYPKHYKRIKLDSNGKKLRDREVTFKDLKITYVDNLKNKVREYYVKIKHYDLLSGLNAIRKLDLAVGKKYNLPVFEKRKLYNAYIDVLRSEYVVTPLGKSKTLVVDLKLRSKHPRATNVDMIIWFSDDKRRIPVKINSQFAFGATSSQLIMVEEK